MADQPATPPQEDHLVSGGETPTGRLTPAAVLAAAGDIVRELGTDGLTMRALGEHLGVSTMAAYRHVPNRAGIVRQLFESVVSAIPPRDERATLADDVAALYSALVIYPGLETAIPGDPEGSPALATWHARAADGAGAPAADAALWLVRGALAAGASDSDRTPILRAAAAALEDGLATATPSEPGRRAA
jgi:AcrR family transcriptional regulator